MSQHDDIRSALFRFGAYTVALAAVLEGIVLVQRKMKGSDELFQEGGFLEWLQLSLLVTSSLILLLSAVKFPGSRELYRLLAVFPILATIRELDYKFDDWFGKGGWGVTSIILFSLTTVFAFKHRGKLRSQFAELVVHRSFGYMASAVVLVLVVSRIIGQKVFWQNYMVERRYTRDVPRAVEEFGELCGYLLLVCGVLELYFTKSEKTRTES